MEHILQFAVSIDEDAIVKMATDRASRQITDEVHAKIESYTKGWRDSKLDELFRDEIKSVVYDNKDEIIEKAIKVVAFNLSKTKTAKDAVKESFSGGGE